MGGDVATAAGADGLGNQLNSIAPHAATGFNAATSGDLDGLANSAANIAGTDTTAGKLFKAGGANANQLQ